MADDISQLIKSVQKRMGGAAVIQPMSEVATPFDTRLPTGILSLDIALKGGLPAGSMVQLFGPDGVGKDYLSNLVIAEVQRKYKNDANIAWMSFGYKPDPSFMELAGVQLSGVGNFMFVDLAAEDSEKPAEVMLDVMLEIVRSQKFQLLVINELGSGETRDNVVKGLGEDAKIATWASLLSNFCRKFYSAMRVPGEEGPNKTCVVMINPVRANMNAHSAKYNPFTQPGGYALKHAKAVDIHLRSGAFIKKSGKKVGKEVKWKISKGKHGISEGAEGEYVFMFNEGVDMIIDLANSAKAHNVVFNKGRFYYILDYEDKIEGGIEGVVKVLESSPKLVNEVRAAVLERTADG